MAFRTLDPRAQDPDSDGRKSEREQSKSMGTGDGIRT